MLSILIKKTERSDTTNLQSSIVNIQFQVGTIENEITAVKRMDRSPAIQFWDFFLNDFMNQVCCLLQFWLKAQSIDKE